MARDLTEIKSDQEHAVALNESLAYDVIREAVACGVREFVICPGARNCALIDCLSEEPSLKLYYHFDERSAAFFAVGLARKKRQPVAVITTSGTAVAELFPAAMEAYYSGDPLLLITADRPRCFRGSGAPQSTYQRGIFGVHILHEEDLESGESCEIASWSQAGPAHINVCFDEGYRHSFDRFPDLELAFEEGRPIAEVFVDPKPLQEFINRVKRPLVIVSALQKKDREVIVLFLQRLGAPVYIEATSGIREDSRLQHLRVRDEKALDGVDAVLRIGGVPTTRLWRDLEYKKGSIEVFSISHLPFSGLSWVDIAPYRVEDLFPYDYQIESFIRVDREAFRKLHTLVEKYPFAEPSLIARLSEIIPEGSNVYVGNSLPIREWDWVATDLNRHYEVSASRGVNGIDGQVSTFLGLCDSEKSNWAILGDQTFLYDTNGLWVLPAIKSREINLVVINNGGGKIFEGMFQNPAFQNRHSLTFEPIAKMWGLQYERWESVPSGLKEQVGPRLIEMCPNDASTNAFRKEVLH